MERPSRPLTCAWSHWCRSHQARVINLLVIKHWLTRRYHHFQTHPRNPTHIIKCIKMLYTVLCCFLILGTQVALPWKVTSYNQRQVHDGEGIEQAHNSWNTLKFLNDPEIIPWIIYFCWHISYHSLLYQNARLMKLHMPLYCICSQLLSESASLWPGCVHGHRNRLSLEGHNLRSGGSWFVYHSIMMGLLLELRVPANPANF
jgi:hypothetical protein